MTHSERYRTNPQYRARAIQRAKEYHEHNKNDPIYLRIINLRKRICEVRDMIELRQKQLNKYVNRLRKMVIERDKLVSIRKGHK